MKTSQLSPADQALVELLRGTPAMTVGDLVDAMGVTATAVRQRLTRLLAMGLLSRSRASHGRGRPSHHYSLTDEGRETSGNNFDDLAVVLWREVQQITDADLRRRVISGAVERLAQKYQSASTGNTLEDRLQAISQMFADQQIPISVEQENGLQVIKVSGCPYPTLAKDNREICEMEQRLLEKIIGHPLDLCQCQQDGDQCCSFQSTSPVSEILTK